ncbi:Putative ankyrin repeat-containing domain superfamily [Colletotrichum destructivum]|uniref:Ankyrin repeat-containing domain superfamily n=1 Tax=Colletotrichum destructivum TaxID=34406 RepID=A0AAX4IKL0_9PEZI|nr:Putative ankyrin repeat-containing domain superfamily [Colletotrichum destructivum]
MHGFLVSEATRQSPTQVLHAKRLNKDPRRRNSPQHQDLIATSLRLGGQKAEELPTNPSQACPESVVPPHPPPSPKAVLGQTDEPPEVSARTKTHEELPGSGSAVCADANVTDSRVLNEVPEPKSKIVAALLDDPSPVATESDDDPYREPKAIPKHRPPVFVYPHSEGKISPKFRQRFREVVNIFMYNIRGSAELRESTQFIDYTLRICGQSPETSHPSILVFCRQRDFKPLHGLLSNDRLRFQYCRKRSSRRDLWSGWPASRRPTTTTDQNVPLFDLYFWRSLQPRELLWGPRSTFFLDQGPSTGIASYLTMCGCLLIPRKNMERRSTLGYVVQLGPDYYGVTASHTFRSAEDEPKLPMARGESTHYDRSAVSAEHKDTVLTSGGSPYSDDWIGQQTENLQIDTSDDNEEFLVDDGEYESFTDEESDTEHVIDGARKKKGVWQKDWKRDEIPVVSFPQLAEYEVLGELDLDWALVKLEDADDWRPNAVMAKNGTDVIFLTEFASEYPERETPVLIATSGGAQFSGNLHSIPSVLGGVNGRVPSVMRTVTLDDGKLLSKGGSGSVVVDALTNQIFGHVVASNPLGEVYVSPVIGLLDHLKARYRETQVRLPEPLSTLRDMIAFHALRKNPALVDRLIQHYAKLDVAYASTHPPNELHQAIYSADVDSVRPLLRPDIYMKSKDYRGGAALHAASLYGHAEIVELIVESGFELDPVDQTGWTPLNNASHGGHAEVVRLLLSKGADPNIPTILTRTPLYTAAMEGHKEVIQLLLLQAGDRLDESARDYRGMMLLHAASQNGHAEVVELLLDRGTDLYVKDAQEETPLHHASRAGHLEVVRLLIERGADVNVEDLYRWTPLHHASRIGHLDVVKLLLDQGARLWAKDVEGWTPLYDASRFGRTEVVKLLLAHGAQVDDEALDGQTPLGCAEEGNHADIYELLLQAGTWDSKSAREKRTGDKIHPDADDDKLKEAKASGHANKPAPKHTKSGIVQQSQRDGEAFPKDSQLSRETRSTEVGTA